jgi:hypothetical protein
MIHKTRTHGARLLALAAAFVVIGVPVRAAD